MTPRFRAGTSDENIWNNINGPGNEYRLPDDMSGWQVLDIGAHIGAFSYACVKRGAGVWAFEPHPWNYRLLLENLWQPIKDGIVTPFQAAVTGNVWQQFPRISGFGLLGEEINTGGPSLFSDRKDGSYHSICVSIRDITGMHNPFDLMKLDCEGSEWDILSHPAISPLMFHRIYGEYHELPNYYTVDQIYDLLPNHNIEHFRHGDSNLGMFFAHRKDL